MPLFKFSINTDVVLEENLCKKWEALRIAGVKEGYLVSKALETYLSKPWSELLGETQALEGVELVEYRYAKVDEKKSNR